MKIFLSEIAPDYNSYTFGYSIYALKEAHSDLFDIYDKGFLPYTGNLNIQEEYFYLCRSVRIDLSKFSDTSENKRLNKKIENLNISCVKVEKCNFDFKDETFIKIFDQCSTQRFSGNAMSFERLDYLISRDTFTDVLEYRMDDKPIVYIFCCITSDIFHYWYSFFDVQLMEELNIGKWSMWNSIHYAKNLGCSYCYLGTCYGSKSSYKFRDHRGVQFFTGNYWSEEIKLLKKLLEKDSETRTEDLFKINMFQTDYFLPH